MIHKRVTTTKLTTTSVGILVLMISCVHNFLLIVDYLLIFAIVLRKVVSNVHASGTSNPLSCEIQRVLHAALASLCHWKLINMHKQFTV